MQNTIKGRMDGGFAGVLQRHRNWFLGFTLAAMALRLFFILRFPEITPDSLVYGDFAKNWLLHGIYGQSFAAEPGPSAIRLPGYPAFLALLFALFGVDHYGAARFVQLFVDLASCFVIADLARRACAYAAHPMRAERAALWAFALAALCPFTANYTAVPLTETWSIFFSAVALDCALAALSHLDFTDLESAAGARWWAGCGLAIAAAIYFRPDGGILLIAIGGYLLVRFALRPGRRTFWAGVLLGVCALGPLLPWTLRNWRTLHRFQPLAPTSATEPGEFVPSGFYRWQMTWLADYAAVQDISFHIDGEPISIADVPARAFDTPEQRQRTEALFAGYNEGLVLTPNVDAGFTELANERIRNAPLCYYLGLPLLRVADVWLRPRTELLPLDVHWWWFRVDPSDSGWALALAGVNLLYLAAAVLGLRRWSSIRYAPLLAAFVVLRTAIIVHLGGIEPRYILECYPVVIALGGVALSRLGRPLKIKAEGLRLKAQGARP